MLLADGQYLYDYSRNEKLKAIMFLAVLNDANYYDRHPSYDRH